MKDSLIDIFIKALGPLWLMLGVSFLSAAIGFVFGAYAGMLWGLYIGSSVVMVVLIVFTLKTGVPPVPTTTRMTRALCAQLPQDFSGKIIDLGSGWGTMVFALTKHCPKATVVGCELAWLPYYWSVMRWRLFNKNANICLVKGDLFQYNLQSIDVLYCYLYPPVMARLKKHLQHGVQQNHIKMHTQLITHRFVLPDVLATASTRVGEPFGPDCTIYRYHLSDLRTSD